MWRECYRLRAKRRLRTAKVASKVLKICSFVPGFIDTVTGEKVTCILDIVFRRSPLWFLCSYIFFLLLLSNVWGQYHIQQRPDTVRWLNFICILQRSGASAQCFASRVVLPEEMQGSGKHEHPAIASTTPQSFSPSKMLNRQLPRPAAPLP